MSTPPTGLAPNPAATEHLPYFIVPPGGTDQMFTVVTVFVLGLILALGVFYFKLHSIPESLAEEKRGNQLQVIGALSLLALFTHNGYFWVAALVLATVTLPDFLTPFRSMARSLLRMSKNGSTKNV
ncbi:hypothetical protein [Falsihalocynthiibacter arcticus]|uniref:Uncharacterized protein n=1 Tax=Falsihalocynthiibacter arcticus TaxID=1579316 RepID=A0A126V1T9_9RHOB|nr:hypothetical protein [Falsihalocynthiibacter arcticus]AML52292.1 hypothetical protein RC74_14325 [Falsihalocynthiibacter arcticus]